MAQAFLSDLNCLAMECIYSLTLSFSSTPGALQLAWPTNPAGYSLQSASNLLASGVWQTVPGPHPR